MRESGVPFTILRSGIVYGPGDTRGFVANMLRAVSTGTVFPLPGGGRNYLHPIHSDDLVSGIQCAIASGPHNETYNLVGPEPIRLRDLVSISAKVLGKRMTFVPIPLLPLRMLAAVFGILKPVREPIMTLDRLHIMSADRQFSCKKAQREIGFVPKKHVAESIPETVCWFLQNEPDVRKLLSIPIGVVQKLAARIQTPFFLFDEWTLRQNFQKIQETIRRFYENSVIFFSVKTNYEPAVLKALREWGSGAEIACGHELRAAEMAGYTGSEMCFDGPVKTEQDQRYAIERNVSIFNVDSYEAAEQLNALAHEYRKRVRVGFRINLGMKGFLKGPAEAYITKFGIDLIDAEAVYQKAVQLPQLDVCGIHTHIGSQITDPALYEHSIVQVVALAKKLEDAGITIQEINVGGGIPSANLTKTNLFDLAASVLPFLKTVTQFFPRKPVPPLEVYAAVIGKTFAREVKTLSHTPRLALEPGRSIVSSMGFLVSRVEHIKKHWVFLDASTYSVPESIFFAKRRFLVPEKLCALDKQEYALAGASLNTADIFSSHELLPTLAPGDLVLILDAGAYSISRATQFTVLNPPVYFLRERGIVELIREKGTYESALAQTHQGGTTIALG